MENLPNLFSNILKVFRNSSECMKNLRKSFEILQKISKSSENFDKCSKILLKIFGNVWKIFIYLRKIFGNDREFWKK